MKLKNQRIVITGASSGIGAALAQECVRRGARVALLARRLDRLHELSQSLKSQGGQVLVVACDVTSAESLGAAFARIKAEWDGWDVVVANAGFGVVGTASQLKIQDYERQFDTNVYGVIRTFHASLEELTRVRGVFCAVGSVASYVSSPGSAPYAMSKFAVRAFMESLFFELKSRGVAAVLISPGFVESEIRRVDNQGHFRSDVKDVIPSWLQVPADKAARVIARALERRSREVIVTQHGKIIVWLNRFFPWVFRLAFGFGVRGRPEATRT